MFKVGLKNLFLFLFLFLIPTQLGRHFWPEWSLVLGIRIDYLSPTLYLIDLIWVSLLFLDLKGNWKKRIKVKSFFNKKTLIFLLLMFLNILMALNRKVAFFGWLRIIQLFLTLGIVRRNKEKINSFLKSIIPIWILLEGFLVMGQISKGGSLNGFWWYLGERAMNFNTIGIAQMSVVGQAVIRAYGSFSHPNSLAGFLLVSLLWWWSYKKKVKSNLWWWIVVWVALVGIILAGSRTIWVLTLISFVLYLKKFLNKRDINFWYSSGIFLALITFVLLLVNINYPLRHFLGGWDENGLLKRGELNIASLKMIKDKVVLGVGSNNFLVKLPFYQKESRIFWLQPVHNIFFLLLSELGFLGLGVLFYWFWNFFKKRKIYSWQWLVLIVIVITGMVDHYWLTLIQNRWLLFLFLGMI